MIEQELWRPILGYENLYEVSSFGRIRSLRGRIIKHYLNKHGYYYFRVCSNSLQKNVYTHKVVFEAFNGKIDPNKVVDHINNIPTDNRLCNLQSITIRENTSKDQKNKTSKYTGVSLYPTTKRWHAQIYVNGKVLHLGYFLDEHEAGMAYKKALAKLTINT